MFQNNEKITELMKGHYPITSAKISAIISSEISEEEDIVKLFLEGADVEYIKNISMEMNKTITYPTTNDKGEPHVITANLMSEYISQLYAVKGKKVNQQLYNLFTSIESSVVILRNKLSRFEDITKLLYKTQKELEQNVAELKSFIDQARRDYRGLSFKRIMDERLPQDNPRLKVLIEAIAAYRVIVYTQITSTGYEMTDAVTHLDRFINAYRDVVILNIQNNIKNMSPNVKAELAFQIAERISKKKTDSSFDFEILKDNDLFMKIPDRK